MGRKGHLSLHNAKKKKKKNFFEKKNINKLNKLEIYSILKAKDFELRRLRFFKKKLKMFLQI